MKKITIFITFFFCTSILSIAQKNEKGLSLNKAYERYLNNVKNRDFDATKTFVSDSDSIQFSDAGGNVVLSMEAYDKQLKKFLNDNSWNSYQSEIISSKQYLTTGIIMEKAIISGENWEFKMVVTYVFHQIDGYWKMVADICTKIEKG